MNTKGKVAFFLGDSITEGVGSPEKANCWARLVAVEGEFDTVVNYGVGGTRIANQREERVTEWSESFCQRIDRMQEGADLILVAGGTNDYGHGDAPLGRMGDKTPDSFYGAVDYIITTLVKKYPTARIAFLTPIHRENEEKYVNEFGVRNCGRLCDYVNAEIEVCHKYGIPVLDMYRLSGICPDIPENKLAFTTDGLHPNDVGYRRMADMILSFIHNVL